MLQRSVMLRRRHCHCCVLLLLLLLWRLLCLHGLHVVHCEAAPLRCAAA